MICFRMTKNWEVYLMKREFVSRDGRWNRPPISANVSAKMVTSVVPATTPSMPKLEQKSTL